MLHLSGISKMVVGFKFTDVNILPHCTDVGNGVVKKMIRLLGAIRKTCSFAGINLNLHNLLITLGK
jgi:hypothetical protein